VPRITYYVAASVDGFIATPDGGVGWLDDFNGTGEDYGYAAFLGSVDALLIGSSTYEQVLTFGPWPYADLPTWVFSQRAIEPAGSSVTVTDADPTDVGAELDARGVEHAWLVGGGRLAQSFRARGLITDLIVSVMPVVLGAGVPLFAPGEPTPLELVSSEAFPGGVVQSHYVSPC
jgi:dihydrofolate reductase